VAAIGLGSGLTLAFVNGVANPRPRCVPRTPRRAPALHDVVVVIAAAGFALGAFLWPSACDVPLAVAPAVAQLPRDPAALAFVASGGGTVSEANLFNVLGLVAFLGWCVWIIAISITMCAAPPYRVDRRANSLYAMYVIGTRRSGYGVRGRDGIVSKWAVATAALAAVGAEITLLQSAERHRGRCRSAARGVGRRGLGDLGELPPQQL